MHKAILSLSLALYCLNASALESRQILQNLLQISDTIRQDLIIEAQQQALIFAELPQVKHALVINSLRKQARTNLEKKIRLDELHNLERAYKNLEKHMPSNLGWLFSRFDPKIFLTRVSNFRALIQGNNDLLARLDKATLDFNPSRQKTRSIFNIITNIYEDIKDLREEYEELEQDYNYNNKALVKNLKELEHYAAHAGEDIKNKILNLQENRELDTYEQLEIFAEDLIEVLSYRGDDPRPAIMAAFL